MANNKTVSSRSLIIIFSAVLVACVAAIFIMESFGGEGKRACIYVEGELEYEIELDEVADSYTIELPGNTVLVEKGQISMLEASCPDKLCVKQGCISSGAHSIACLPNRVMITIESAGNGVDAVVG